MKANESFLPHVTVIESEQSYLQSKAEKAQKQLFADPMNLSAKRNYGHALLQWARATKNRKAQAFAKSLLEATK